MIVRNMAFIGASTVALLAFGTVGAHAQSAGYCEGVAEAAADRQAPRGGVIGEVVTTIDGVFTGGSGYDARWRAAYDAALDACIETSGAQALDVPEARVIRQAPETRVIREVPETTVIQEVPRAVVETPVVTQRYAVVARPEPWTPQWYSYCSTKYRSFDPGTGTYVTYSGETMLCR